MVSPIHVAIAVPTAKEPMERRELIAAGERSPGTRAETVPGAETVSTVPDTVLGSTRTGLPQPGVYHNTTKR